VALKASSETGSSGTCPLTDSRVSLNTEATDKGPGWAS
jgi:hypothetical protein